MANGQSVAILDPLRRLIGRQTGSALTDAELLENFVVRRDPASFEVLVWRHGAMVLALCKRLLRDAHEAEDAFQATFLVFARKAASIGRRESVGCWLYKVAYRVALRLRAAAEKRPATGEPARDVPAPPAADDADWRDLRPVLDDEIARLPEKYRAPFVLCYLEGRTNEEAAAQLGCPKGTILSRLARGREWLRSRLARRGVALSAAALASTLTRNAASAAVPALLACSTTDAAIPFAAGTVVADLVPPHVAALTHGALHAMTLTNVKTTAAALVALLVLGAGIGWTASAADRPDRSDRTDRRAPAVAPAAQDRAPERAAQPARPAEWASLVGRVLDVAKDGKSFGVAVPPATRDEAPRKVVVKIWQKTAITYHGVGANGATPTPGYDVQVRFEDGSTELAAEITFTGSEGGPRTPQTAGTVAEVAKDGKGITLQLPPIRGLPREDSKKIPIKFDDKTVLTFSNVGPGGASLTAGHQVRVWYADDGTTAGMVQFTGSAVQPMRGGRTGDLGGKVVAVGKDNTSITLEVPPTMRGEAAKRVDVKLNDKTAIQFNNVPLDGAKLAEGQQAQVWLAEGSKDTAARLSVTGTVPQRWTIVTGKVVAVAKDGGAITIELPPTARGGEPKRIEVKLTEKTKTAFHGVGPGEAKPAEGLEASVRLLDGSRDAAAQVTFSKPGTARPRPEE
jgi:RNA polymerase sigma factor (sigma-70 family)